METRNHFMPVALLQSQLDALEPPIDAVVLNSSLPLEKMIQQLKPHLSEQENAMGNRRNGSHGNQSE